jgi:DNA-binding transcriptional MerR regulator
MSAPTMHSNELAALAGVTVRTLRHYHQIGLLPEPARSSNGYRRYSVRDLATVLRILSFTELGVPLSEVRRVVDDPSATAELLDGIDRQAADEIDRLTARRKTIALLRREDAAPDLPAALIPYAALLRPRAGASDHERIWEREQLALIRHLSEDAGLAWLVRAYESFATSPARYLTLTDEFSALADDASSARIEQLADEVVALVGEAFSLDEAPSFRGEAASLLLAHQDGHYNDAQRRVIALVVDRVESTEPPA